MWAGCDHSGVANIDLVYSRPPIGIAMYSVRFCEARVGNCPASHPKHSGLKRHPIRCRISRKSLASTAPALRAESPARGLDRCTQIAEAVGLGLLTLVRLAVYLLAMSLLS